MTPTGETMIDHPVMTPPIKRSVTIDGHRTSVSLEEAFWIELRHIARHNGATLASVISLVDHQRPPEVGLATALRLYVLSEVQTARTLAARAVPD